MNLALEVRELVSSAVGLPGPEYVFSDTPILPDLPIGFSGCGNDDELAAETANAQAWFWQQIEQKYSIAVTKAQRQSLKTVGDLLRYLEIRLKQEAPA